MPSEITVNAVLTGMIRLNECLKHELAEPQNQLALDLIGVILVRFQESLGPGSRGRVCLVQKGDPIYDACEG